ncbi:MAG: HlyD family secretion protein [Bacillus sp. (in: Bacteria)]|nr:HlyD family secretion protein [Bacillus sp. (in: firmicutes)]MCM1425418.1 HlyD family secretion protein [Eubacterium sp.]
MRKKKIIAGFLIFMGFMWLCTVISKSIYASRLPVVSVEKIDQKYIEHIVEAEGIVIAGDKVPVTALSGLRIDKVMVQVGDRIEEGDALFSVDMEDLNAIMEEKQTQIAKVQTQVDTILQNKELASQKKELEEARAREDYDALARYEDTLVGRAAEEVNKAEHELEAQIEIQEEKGEHWSEEDEAVKQALEEALQSAAYAEADAKWQRENSMKDAGRKVEDILLPEDIDAALSGYQMELAELREDLAKYQEIKDLEGQVAAERSGLVTDVYISVGGRIPDSAVMLLADDEVPCQFKTMIDKEQKKYVGLNDKVSLKLDGSSRENEMTVDYLSESETMPGSYDIYINLPEGTGMPGLSGTMKHSETGEKYNCCLSPLAVHSDNTRSYVYVVKEREGILGMEYYVEEVNVRVLDKNDYWVAVEGALDSESQVIVSSTKEIKNGEIVRF